MKKLIIPTLLILSVIVAWCWIVHNNIELNENEVINIAWSKTALMDYIYAIESWFFQDIRNLSPNYGIEQAKADDVIILTDNNRVFEYFNYIIPLWRDKKFKSSFVRFAQNTVEWDLVIYDIFYDTTSSKIYFITDFTRDKFSSQEDRIIDIKEFEHIWTYEHNWISYWVLYNWELNDETFQSENTYVLTILQ